MKKKSILAVIALFAAMCLVLGACEGNKKEPSKNGSDPSGSSDALTGSDDAVLINEIYGKNGRYPYITLEAEKDNVSVGDTVNVMLKLNNAENVACFDINIKFDTSVLTLSEYDEANISGFIFETSVIDGGLLFSGFTARTADFDGEDVITLTFNVNSGASADSTVISASASDFMIGTDKSGDVIADLTAVQELSGECAIALTE